MLNVKRELKSLALRRGIKEKMSYAKKGKVYTESEATMLAKSLGENIEDSIGGSYVSLSLDVKDQNELEAKLVKQSKKIKKKKSIVSARGLAVSKAVNMGRRDVFESVEDRIESYTYYNDEPVTSLCTYLNGKTFKAGREKYPPFHWGCDGYIVPNLKEWKKNPKIDKIKVTSKMRKGMDFFT